MSYQVYMDKDGNLQVRIGFDCTIPAEAFENGTRPSMSRESLVWILTRISALRNS